MIMIDVLGEEHQQLNRDGGHDCRPGKEDQERERVKGVVWVGLPYNYIYNYFIIDVLG